MTPSPGTKRARRDNREGSVCGWPVPVLVAGPPEESWTLLGFGFQTRDFCWQISVL